MLSEYLRAFGELVSLLCIDHPYLLYSLILSSLRLGWRLWAFIILLHKPREIPYWIPGKCNP